MCKGIPENIWLILEVIQCFHSSSEEVFVGLREVLHDACVDASFSEDVLKDMTTFAGLHLALVEATSGFRNVIFRIDEFYAFGRSRKHFRSLF